MRIRQSDVMNKLDYLNQLLAQKGSSLRVTYSGRYSYNVLEETRANDLSYRTYGVLCSGTKKECYEYVCAMLRGIDMYNFRKG